MDAKILKQILTKIDAREKDILSIGETWLDEDLSEFGIKERIKSKYQFYDVQLKSGRRFYLKREAVSGTLKSIEDIGYNLMV